MSVPLLYYIEYKYTKVKQGTKATTVQTNLTAARNVINSTRSSRGMRSSVQRLLGFQLGY